MARAGLTKVTGVGSIYDVSTCEAGFEEGNAGAVPVSEGGEEVLFVAFAAAED